MSTTIKHIDTFNALIPANWELGIRDRRYSAERVTFKIGAYHATAWVDVRMTADDLYAVEIYKVRSGKRTILVTIDGVYADRLASALIDAWCAICDAKGW
jgi:hypothetical protein